MWHKEKIIILDFGSQYTQLIARKVRECNVFSEIHSHSISSETIKKYNPSAIILSGGPASVSAQNSPTCDPKIFKLGIPILGICYGMQLMVQVSGGRVGKAKAREYGDAVIKVKKKDPMFKGMGQKIKVWMSHGDMIYSLPKNFEIIASSENCPYAAIRSSNGKMYGLQFHPEVVHTVMGKVMIKRFLKDVANCSFQWTMRSFVESTLSGMQKKIGNEKVLCALSGGVDSSVLSVLLHKAIGKNLTCVFVNNGLLRKNEEKKVISTFRNKFRMKLIYVNAERLFLKSLKGVEDPEKKRKIIGKEFIRVFENKSKKLGKIKFLAQGTLYPDVIESRSAFGGPSSTIKTHHNVGGLPKKMKLKLVEPFKELFKDEVRLVGKELGLPREIINRQPFPGPGLSVRIIGAVTKRRLNILRFADAVILDEIKKANLYEKIWQAFGVLLPIKTVGVMGDERTYENVLAVRAVTSVDGMTADWARLPESLLAKISNRIINEVKGINRVVYDISSKPPATIEWE